MSERILIIGSEGFVGKYLSNHLASLGYEVHGAGMFDEESAHYHLCDVTQIDEIRQVLNEVGELKAIFHLAAVAHVRQAMDEPTTVMDVNLNGTINLAEAMIELCPAARLIFISTSQVYGFPHSLPVTEEHPLNPTNPYAISKLAAEQYLSFLAKSRGLRHIVLRPYNHSGAGQNDSYSLPSFAHQIARIEAGKKEPVIEVGNLDVSRDFSHVKDIVRAYGMALKLKDDGQTFNLCSGRKHDLGDTLDDMIAKSKVKIEVRVNRELYRPVDIPEEYGSHENFTHATGWKPELDINDILDDLLDYWRGVEAG